MKARQYKKLCKKAATLMGFKSCCEEDGVWYFTWCCGYDSEWEAEGCWPWLVSCFDADVNTVVDEDSECGLSWVGKSKAIKPTPKNVFAWARNQTEWMKL